MQASNSCSDDSVPKPHNDLAEILNNYITSDENVKNNDINCDSKLQDNNTSTNNFLVTDSKSKENEKNYEFLEAKSNLSDSDGDYCESSEEEIKKNEEEDKEKKEETVLDKLRKWAMNNWTPHTQVDQLLNPVLLDLPLTSKTFFKLYGKFKYVKETFPLLKILNSQLNLYTFVLLRI